MLSLIYFQHDISLMHFQNNNKTETFFFPFIQFFLFKCFCCCLFLVVCFLWSVFCCLILFYFFLRWLLLWSLGLPLGASFCSLAFLTFLMQKSINCIKFVAVCMPRNLNEILDCGYYFMGLKTKDNLRNSRTMTFNWIFLLFNTDWMTEVLYIQSIRGSCVSIKSNKIYCSLYSFNFSFLVLFFISLFSIHSLIISSFFASTSTSQILWIFMCWFIAFVNGKTPSDLLEIQFRTRADPRIKYIKNK